MSVSIEVLGIDRLSVCERLNLIEQILDSLPEQVSPDEIPEWPGAMPMAPRGHGRAGIAREKGMLIVRSHAHAEPWACHPAVP